MYYVSLKQFEGPIDLLLHLITRAKVDIKDIFVSEITEQYLASMGSVDELDMDTASEFLTMAATLLEIKSRALLPRPPEPAEDGEETPEAYRKRLACEFWRGRRRAKSRGACSAPSRATASPSSSACST